MNLINQFLPLVKRTGVFVLYLWKLTYSKVKGTFADPDWTSSLLRSYLASVLIWRFSWNICWFVSSPNRVDAKRTTMIKTKSIKFFISVVFEMASFFLVYMELFPLNGNKIFKRWGVEHWGVALEYLPALCKYGAFSYLDKFKYHLSVRETLKSNDKV